MKKILKYKKITIFITATFCILMVNLFISKNALAVGYIQPRFVGEISNNEFNPIVAFPEFMNVSGHYAYFGSNITDTLEVADISDPAHLVQAGYLSDGVGGARLKGMKMSAISGHYLYTITNTDNTSSATQGNILEVVDIADPTHPVHAGSLLNGDGGANINFALGIFVSGNYVYIPSTNGNALEIVNVSDPTHPVHAGSLATGVGGALLSTPEQVAVSGNYAYVTAYGNNALEVVNISDPAHPVHAGSLANGVGGAKLAHANGISIQGNFAYITAWGSNALEIVNISDPAHPVHAGSLLDGAGGAKLLTTSEVFVSGNYAYVSCYNSNAVNVINISDPAHPALTGLISDGDGGALLTRPRGIYVTGGNAYVAVSASNAIEVINVSNPVAPVHTSALVPSIYLGNPRSVKMLNNRYAYVLAANSNALQVIDELDPAHPTEAGSLVLRYGGAQLYSPMDIAFNGHYGYIVSAAINVGIGAVEVIDISDPAHPTHVAAFLNGDYLSGAYGIAIRGNYAFITGFGNNALEVEDISNPVLPVHVATLANGSGALLSQPWGITLSGNYAYIASSGSNALEVVNISDPTHPTHAGSLANGAGGALLNGPRYIAISGNYAYVTSWTGNNLEVVNISDPTHPTHASSLSDGVNGAILNNPFGISISDNYAYIGSSGGNGLEVVDISSPTSPTHFSSIINGTNGAKLIRSRGVDISGDYIYVAAYDGSSNALDSIRIKDSVSPTITLQGSSSVSVSKGDTYTDAGATASDDLDGNITANIITVNNVNTNVLGTYTITYNVSDASNNSAIQVTRTVNVIDTSLPIITLLGSSNVSLYVGSTYLDLGATALDDVDGNLTSHIVTINNVDTNILGTYTVTYNVSDSSNNPAEEVTRTVLVKSKPNTSGGYLYGCSDPKALNFKSFVASKSSLCEYAKNSTVTYITKTNIPVTSISRILKQGMKGLDVLALQKYLNAKKYLLTKKDLISTFGPKTKRAVVLFQKAHNLKADGVVGEKTWEAMDKLKF